MSSGSCRPGEKLTAGLVVFEHRDCACKCWDVSRDQRLKGCGCGAEICTCGTDHFGDHPVETETLAVLGGEDANATLRKQRDLFGHDDAATASEDLDVTGALLRELVGEVGEVLDMSTLIGRHRYGVRVLTDGSAHHLVDTAVVTEVDDFGALRLQDASHDVDGGVVAVKEACGGHETNRRLCRLDTHSPRIPWTSNYLMSYERNSGFIQVSCWWAIQESNL